MKKLFFLAFILSAIASEAQFNERKWTLEGDLIYNSALDLLVISPGIGRAIGDNKLIGISPSIIGFDGFQEPNYGVSIWYDKYKMLGEEFPLYLNFRWFGRYQQLTGDIVDVGIAPGVSFLINEKWLLSARFLQTSLGFSFDEGGIFFEFGTGGSTSFAFLF